MSHKTQILGQSSHHCSLSEMAHQQHHPMTTSFEEVSLSTLAMPKLQCSVSDCAIKGEDADKTLDSNDKNRLSFTSRTSLETEEDYDDDMLSLWSFSADEEGPVPVVHVGAAGSHHYHHYHPFHHHYQPPNPYLKGCLNSQESIGSIISAITLPDSLMCNNENSHERFGKSFCQASMPRFPIRQGSVFGGSSSSIFSSASSDGGGSFLSSSCSLSLGRKSKSMNPRSSGGSRDTSPVMPERKQRNRVHATGRKFGKAMKKLMVAIDEATTITVVPLEKYNHHNQERGRPSKAPSSSTSVVSTSSPSSSPKAPPPAAAVAELAPTAAFTSQPQKGMPTKPRRRSQDSIPMTPARQASLASLSSSLSSLH